MKYLCKNEKLIVFKKNNILYVNDGINIYYLYNKLILRKFLYGFVSLVYYI